MCIKYIDFGFYVGQNLAYGSMIQNLVISKANFNTSFNKHMWEQKRPFYMKLNK